MDPVLCHHTSQERQPVAVPELPNDQPHQPPKQSHAKIILKRLKLQVEKIIAEKQAGFRVGRSTTEQIFNLRILCEKHLQHQHLLCLYRLQEGPQQGLACSFVGNHEEVPHQRQPFLSNQTPL